jgi:hypothetical protein
VSFIEATQLPGYKEVKALPIAPGSGVNIIAPSTPLPAAGTLRVTQFGRSTRT